MYRTVNNMIIVIRGRVLDLRTSGKECDDIGRVRTGYGVVGNELGIACFIE